MSYSKSCLIAVGTLLIIFVGPVPAFAKNSDIKCESLNYKRTECGAKHKISKVVLKVQHSKAKCINKKTYGITGKGKKIWVNGGCRGTFNVSS